MIYKNLFVIFILLLKNIYIVYSEPIVLNLLINSANDDDNASHRKLINEFNNVYSVVNNLNIKINLTPVTPINSTPDIRNYGDMFSSSLAKEKKDFDLVHFYSAYSKTYGEFFEDLRKYLPEDILNEYDKTMLEKACTNKDDKLVGLPFSLLLNVLYSNTALLRKYNKTAPKTWNELMETSKYIYDNELNKGNEITRFFDPLNDRISGSLSIYEFINSFRESNDLPYPPLKSLTTIEALQKLKNMTLEIGQDNFKSEFTMLKLFNPNTTLFMSFSYFQHDKDLFMATTLPGNNENVTGTVINTTNFGINKYISDKRKKASAEFLKFVAMKETQEEFVIKEQFLAGNMEAYKNRDKVCQLIECDIADKIQSFSYFNNDKRFFGDDDYFPQYQGLLEYIFGDEPITYVLQRLEDYTKIYKFSLKTDDSVVGLITFVFFLILLTCISLSIIFIFIKKFEYRFIFLSKNLWVITTLGTLILLSSTLTIYGEVTNAQCHLRITLINVGFVLSICPSLHKLITNFPKKNKISSTFKINKYITIIIIMLFTVALNEIFAMASYSIKEIIPNEINQTDKKKIGYKKIGGKHFHKCVMENTFGNIIYGVIQFFNFTIILISLILIFMEWNLKETSLDVKYLATALFMDTLSLILLIIFDKITINDYILHNIVLAMNIMLFAVSNHIFIYLVRILPIFRPDNSYEDSRKILGKLASSSINGSNKRTLPNSSHNMHSKSSSSSFSKGSMAYYSNLANSHYNNTGTSIYNNMGTSSYNNMGVSSYNSNSNSYPSKSNSTSTSSSNRKVGFAKRIMDYHNQIYIN